MITALHVTDAHIIAHFSKCLVLLTTCVQFIISCKIIIIIVRKLFVREKVNVCVLYVCASLYKCLYMCVCICLDVCLCLYLSFYINICICVYV